MPGSQECVDSVIETLVRRVDVIASGADPGAGPAPAARAITWSAVQTVADNMSNASEQKHAIGTSVERVDVIARIAWWVLATRAIFVRFS